MSTQRDESSFVNWADLKSESVEPTPSPEQFLDNWHKYQNGIKRTAKEYLIAAMQAYADMVLSMIPAGLRPKLNTEEMQELDECITNSTILDTPCVVCGMLVGAHTTEEIKECLREK